VDLRYDVRHVLEREEAQPLSRHASDAERLEQRVFYGITASALELQARYSTTAFHFVQAPGRECLKCMHSRRKGKKTPSSRCLARRWRNGEARGHLQLPSIEQRPPGRFYTCGRCGRANEAGLDAGFFTRKDPGQTRIRIIRNFQGAGKISVKGFRTRGF